MIQAVMRVRLLAVLLSLPLAASGVAGVVLHVCQSMGGLVVGDCDCQSRSEATPSGHEGCDEHAAPPAQAKLETQPCCTVELTETNRWVAAQQVPSDRISDATVAFLAVAGGDGEAWREVCDLGLLRERGPPNAHGPPIFIRNCSLLN